MAEDFNPYHVWLGIPPNDQPANHYRLLSINLFETSADVIDNAADRQMAHLRTFQTGKHADLSQRLLNELAAARVCLLDPKKRAVYDEQLRANLAAATPGGPAAGSGAAPGGSAIHRQPPRRATGQLANTPIPAPIATALPTAAPISQPADPWDDQLGDLTIKSPNRGAKKKTSGRSPVYLVAGSVLVAAVVGIGVFATSNSAPANGTLVFDLPAVADASVTLDDALTTIQANGRLEIASGAHHIAGERPAYKFAADVTVVAGHDQTVAIDWKPKAVLVLDWPLAMRGGAELTIDGRAKIISQRTPLEIAVEPGRHTIEIARPGAAKIQTSATVAPDGRQLVNITPPPTTATLVLDWPPQERSGAELTVDGHTESVAASPSDAPLELTVEPGRHVVRIHRAGFESFSTTVELDVGANKAIKPSWTPEQKSPVVDTPSSAAAESTPQPVKTLAPPSAEEQARIAKQLDDLYKLSRNGAKSTAQAQELYDVAAKAGSAPAERYELLLKGAELAAVAGDFKLATQGIDTIDADYEIDPLDSKQKLFDKFIGAAKADRLADAIPVAEQLIDQAVAADRFETAILLSTSASRAATKSQLTTKKTVEDRLAHRRNEIRAIVPIYATVQKAKQTLDKNPSDPDANLTLGRWQCFYKNDWQSGLPLLAKGSDEKLKALAAAELQSPSDTEQQARLADGWWDIAQKESGLGRDTVLVHAGEFYKAVMPNLNSALRKALIEKRLTQTAGLTPLRPSIRKREQGWVEPTRTELVGGDGGHQFEDTAPSGLQLVGFEITTGKPFGDLIITSIKAIFSGPSGTFYGQLRGRPSDDVVTVRAKDGYVVGGIVAKVGRQADGLKVEFTRFQGNQLIANESYESDWVGGRGGGDEVTMAGDGRTVIGICGRSGIALDKFGLVQAGDGAASASTAATANIPLNKWIDVLPLVDADRDVVGGTWRRDGAELVAEPNPGSRVAIPLVVDGSYDLAIEFTRASGSGGVAALLSVDSRPFMLELSSLDGSGSGLMVLDGHFAWVAENPISVQPGTLENDHRYRLSVSVRTIAGNRASVDVSLDGKPYLPHWEGSPTSLRAHEYWTMPNSKGLGFGTSAAVTFHSVKLRVVSGHASVDPAAAGSTAEPNPRPTDNAGQLPPVALDYVATEHTWKSGQPAVHLIPTRGGFCCLSSVGGHFDAYSESAGIRAADNGYWSLGGQSAQPYLAAKAVSFQRLPPAMFQGRVKEFAWRNGDPPVKMLQKNTGICVLSGVAGHFAGSSEEVRVRLDDDGYWYLEGKSRQKELGATAIGIEWGTPGMYRVEIQQYAWKNGDQSPVRILDKNQGFAFLSAVSGKFVGDGDEVQVYVGDDGAWYLSGKSGKGQTSAKATAVRLFK